MIVSPMKQQSTCTIYLIATETIIADEPPTIVYLQRKTNRHVETNNGIKAVNL